MCRWALIIPNNGAWMVSNAAFRILAQEAAERLDRPEDREVLVGQAVNGLFLDQLDLIRLVEWHWRSKELLRPLVATLGRVRASGICPSLTP